MGGNQVHPVTLMTQSATKASTLQSIVDYLSNDIDQVISGCGSKVVIQIDSPTEVWVMSEVNLDLERSQYLRINADLPDEIAYGHFYDMEQFNIMLQSRFVNAEDRAKLLALVGNVKEDGVRTIGDDGISQSATVKTGVATVADVQVPNPVTLAPYRTFAEVEQPASDFVFRMQSGPKAALFEADGGAWRIEAIANIREWLEGHLEDTLGSAMQKVTILS